MPEPIDELSFDELKLLRADMALLIRTLNSVADEMRATRDQFFEFRWAQIKFSEGLDRTVTRPDRLDRVEQRLDRIERRLELETA